MIAYEIQLRYDVTVATLPHTAVVFWVTITSAQTVSKQFAAQTLNVPGSHVSFLTRKV